MKRLVALAVALTFGFALPAQASPHHPNIIQMDLGRASAGKVTARNTVVVQSNGFDTATFDYTDGASGDPKTNVVATWNPAVTGQPWVALLHGGTWSAGDNIHYETSMAALFQKYGWATFNIDYRDVQYVGGPQQEADVEQAVVWLRSHWVGLHLDKTKGTLYGFSAGGHLAALTAYEYPGLVQDVVTASGAVQPQRLAEDILGQRPDEPIDPTWGPYAMSRMTEWTGCDFQVCGQEAPWHNFEPETFLSISSVPIWMISGDQDNVVYPGMTNAFAAKVAAQNVEQHVTIAPGFGHTENDILTVTPNAQGMLKFIIAHVHAGSW